MPKNLLDLPPTGEKESSFVRTVVQKMNPEVNFSPWGKPKLKRGESMNESIESKENHLQSS